MWFVVTTLLVLSTYLVVSKYHTWKETEHMKHSRLFVQGYIYFIRLKGDLTRVKIGRSNNPIRRIKELRTSAPHGMEVLGVMPVFDAAKSEAMIHELFQWQRISKKNEWFRWSPRLDIYIRAMSDQTLTNIVRKAVE